MVLDLITQFCGVPRGRWSFVLPEISRGKVRKLKFPGFFSKKVFSQHPSVWNYKRKSCKISPLDETIRRVVYFRHFYILWYVCYPNSNPFPPPSQECTFKWNMLFRGFLIDLKFSNGSLPVKKLTDFAGVLVLSHKILEGCNKMGYSRKKPDSGGWERHGVFHFLTL